MNVTIKNNILSVEINTLGAELKSLKKSNREYLWQGCETSWNASSPQLFPVIGSQPEGGWKWKDKNIILGNHGFARKSEFTLLESEEDRAVFQLKNSDETYSQYPFAFTLQISYILKKDTLTVSYEVSNPSDEVLPFSLGAHPGFNCPLESSLNYTDYYLEFNKKETINRRWKNDFLTGETTPMLEHENRINLNYTLFNRGAIIFSGLESDTVCLKSDRSDYSVKMNFTGFPDFGIWTKQEAEAAYICLEPWFGVDSTEGDNPDFSKKEGIINLNAGKKFNCSYSLGLS